MDPVNHELKPLKLSSHFPESDSNPRPSFYCSPRVWAGLPEGKKQEQNQRPSHQAAPTVRHSSEAMMDLSGLMVIALVIQERPAGAKLLAGLFSDTKANKWLLF
jgi:hypothetical protein